MPSLDDAAAAQLHPKWTKATSKSRATPKPKLNAPGLPAAILPEERSAADLAALLEQFRRDVDFRTALVALAHRLLAELGDETTKRARADQWPSAIADLRRDERYLPALTDFAAAWKLDRLPKIKHDEPDGRTRTEHYPEGLITEGPAIDATLNEPIGLEMLHAWLVPRFFAWSEGEQPADADALSFGGGIMTGESLGHVVERDEEGEPIVLRQQRNEETGEIDEVEYRLRLPGTSLQLTVAYDPSAESRADARARNRAALEGVLDAIEAEYRDAGYVFADAAHRREKHAEWLYQRLVKGQSYRTIADAWNRDKKRLKKTEEEAVRQAVHRFADRIGIDNLATD